MTRTALRVSLARVHAISAIIGAQQLLERFRRDRPRARLVELPQGFALVAATDELIAEAGPGALVPGFYFLTETLACELEALSREAPLVFVETEYFGGPGGQAAIVFRDGRRAFAASTHEDSPLGDEEWPISTALRSLGVERGDALDEFEAIGLGRLRSTERWEAAGR